MDPDQRFYITPAGMAKLEHEKASRGVRAPATVTRPGGLSRRQANKLHAAFALVLAYLIDALDKNDPATRERGSDTLRWACYYLDGYIQFIKEEQPWRDDVHSGGEAASQSQDDGPPE